MTITAFNTQAIQKFISCNKLNKADGIILFDAIIIFYTNNSRHKITSRVQIITLPSSMAVYIFEFFNEHYKQADMYSTIHHHFYCTETNELEISSDTGRTGSLICIQPL